MVAKCIDEYARVRKENAKRLLEGKTRSLVQGKPFDESTVRLPSLITINIVNLFSIRSTWR